MIVFTDFIHISRSCHGSFDQENGGFIQSLTPFIWWNNPQNRAKWKVFN